MPVYLPLSHRPKFYHSAFPSKSLFLPVLQSNTFPSDEFMKEEIQRSKDIGLNGIRTHIKVELPRKLYWAGKLGLLIMEDLPNSWGEPDEKMRAESEYTLRQMIKRDYNHPLIFSWVIFNETWGLKTAIDHNGNTKEVYLPETQHWVASMYYLAKSLDQTRLVEDNSICCGFGHTKTDINSWHVYLPGWEWEDYLKKLTDSTFEGSGFNFEVGFRQGNQPNINSECGNVWGYDGSTGDVDWSWDYHRMINTFRKYPKVAGWLYTEYHDVINEWNGYWRFDRSEKETGLSEIVPGMTLNDLHAAVYLSTAKELFVKGQEEFNRDQDYMKGSKVAPSSNPNSYPMTDETKFPSQVSILIGGNPVHTTTLGDDPADHRGVLSWHHQLRDGKLREAGSYGYQIKVSLSKKMMHEATRQGQLRVQIRSEGGGVAIYGRQFGRYPWDPSLVVKN